MTKAGKFDRVHNPGTARCGVCGTRRQMANMSSSGTVCVDCWELAGIENEHLDTGHPDGCPANCPLRDD